MSHGGIDKKKLIEAFCEQLEKDLQVAKSSAAESRDAATNEESKPENQYDTRALEASYLAGAQAHRAKELETQILFFKQVDLKSYAPQDPIGPTALVQIESEGQRSWVFMMSHAGGISVKLGGENIQVITPSSPLGEALVGLRAGDAALMESPKQVREYEILKVE